MKNALKNVLAVVVLLLSVLLIVFILNLDPKKEVNAEKSSSESIVLNNKVLNIELADDSFSRMKGLSGYAELKDGSGMLFVFDKPDLHGFWMKDMNFPIDIIWFNEFREVVYIKKDLLPSSYPNIFVPNQKALYVLEVTAGFSDKAGLSLGDKFEFSTD